MATLDDLHDALDRVGRQAGRPVSAYLDPALTDAAKAAVALGLADSVSALTGESLHRELRRLALGAVLEEHFQRHPEDRPSSVEVALYLAQARGMALAELSDPLRTLGAVADALGDDPHPEDILVAARAHLALTSGSAA